MTSFAGLSLLSALALSGTRPETLEVKVESATLTTRLRYESGWALAPRGYKYLVLRYTVRNSSRNAREYSRESVSFGVRSENGTRSAGTAPARLLEAGRLELGPGRAVRDVVWLEVPNDAQAPVVTLRTEGGEEEVSLPSEVKNELAPYGDRHSRVARDEVQAEQGRRVELGMWDIRVDEATIQLQSPSYKLAGAPGQRYVVVPVRYFNPARESQALSSDSGNWSVLDADGKALNWNRLLFGARGPETLDQEVGPGRAVEARLVFLVDPRGQGGRAPGDGPDFGPDGDRPARASQVKSVM